MEVGMFPQIDSKNRSAKRLCNSTHKRIIFVVCLSDYQIWFGFTNAQPYPARQNSRAHSFVQALDETFKRSVLLFNLFAKTSAWLTFSLSNSSRCGPKQQVIEVSSNSNTFRNLMKARSFLCLLNRFFS